MQFDKDMDGNFAELFLSIRDLILENNEVSEKLNVHQTSYFVAGRSICFLRSDAQKLVLALSFGYKLAEEYDFITGCGKIVRHWNFYTTESPDLVLIKELIAKSIMYAQEKSSHC
jgi:hypothetical protein